MRILFDFPSPSPFSQSLLIQNLLLSHTDCDENPAFAWLFRCCEMVWFLLDNYGRIFYKYGRTNYIKWKVRKLICHWCITWRKSICKCLNWYLIGVGSRIKMIVSVFWIFAVRALLWGNFFLAVLFYDFLFLLWFSEDHTEQCYPRFTWYVSWIRFYSIKSSV